MLRNLGPFELLIIVLIIMVLFGGKKIPELMHGLGKGISEFKRASQGGDDPAKDAATTTTTTTTTPVAPKV
jgi:sec-independent protein translocase protein TatA